MSKAKVKAFKGSLNIVFDEQSANTEDACLVRQIDIQQIVPRSEQPRKTFDEVNIQALAESIQAVGVLQPITVQARATGQYEIIVGERRWRAAKKAGLQQIPCLVKIYDEQQMMSAALIENLHREDLEPLEIASGIAELIRDYHMTHEQVAKKLGRSRVTITHLLRLLDLAEPVKQWLREGQLSLGHVKVLLSLSEQEQTHLGKRMIARGLSVREAESMIANHNATSSRPEVEPWIRQQAKIWQDNLSKQLATRVNVSVNPKGQGRVVINFSCLEEADRLLQQLAVEVEEK